MSPSEVAAQQAMLVDKVEKLSAALALVLDAVNTSADFAAFKAKV